MPFLSFPSIPWGVQEAEGCESTGGPAVGGWVGFCRLCSQTLATWLAEGRCLLLAASIPGAEVRAETDLFPS